LLASEAQEGLHANRSSLLAMNDLALEPCNAILGPDIPPTNIDDWVRCADKYERNLSHFNP
jgi:hypothetical protein